MVVIPAIDIIDGKCVRLTRGDYGKKKTYDSNPLDVAKRFEDAGLRYLHMVDLDGAKRKKIVNHAVLEEIASETSLHIDFGGGVQSEEDIRIAFEAGARKVTGGSIAVKNEDLFLKWIDKYGPEKIILGADVRGRDVAISGWQEKSGKDWQDFLRFYIRHGVRYVISTDIDRDGMLNGPAIELYREMHSAFPDLQIIASGGISGMDDLKAVAELGIWGVIVGKAIYEGRIDLAQLKKMDN